MGGGMGIESQHDDVIRLRITDTGDNMATVNIFDTFMTACMKEDYDMTESGEVIVTLDGGTFEVIEDG